MKEQIQIAILDDYQRAALQFADWSTVQTKAKVVVFNDHSSDEDELVTRLYDFQVICIMRERTPFSRQLMSRLPNLQLIVSTGKRNASLDVQACEELGIKVEMTGYLENGAPELTWTMLMAMARNVVTENSNMRSGNWQTTIGTDLRGKTIGIIGLGRVGSKIAQYAKAFEMKVIAWSDNMTEERAHRAGAELVNKQDLFRWSDFITVHLVLSERSRNIIGTDELALMKPSAYIINTSRGPLIDEAALIDVLANRKIAGAALDVFNEEPLSTEHPFRTLQNVLATPHIGYVTEDTYKLFYGDTVKAIESWLNESH